MKLPPEPLSQAEVRALLGACSRRGSAGIRDTALIVLLWRTGLRIAEALALMPKDVDLEHGVVRVLHGKGDRHRAVGLDPQACAVIERWMRRRRELGIGARAPVFCVISHPTRGKAIHASVFREKLKDLAEKAGLEKRVHPHGFRHTHAFELCMEGQPLNIIRQQLGHRSIATTERYIDHLAPSAVISVMQTRTWDAAAAG